MPARWPSQKVRAVFEQIMPRLTALPGLNTMEEHELPPHTETVCHCAGAGGGSGGQRRARLRRVQVRGGGARGRRAVHLHAGAQRSAPGVQRRLRPDGAGLPPWARTRGVLKGRSGLNRVRVVVCEGAERCA